MSWLASLTTFSGSPITHLALSGQNDAERHPSSHHHDLLERRCTADTTFRTKTDAREDEEEEKENMRGPYLHCMIAGGIGGSTGDMLMHSIDTVKTRQQGDTHVPSRYGTLTSAYRKIFVQEGIRRGLYSGVSPALLGSFPGTIAFFGTYEYSKRHMIDAGMNHTLAYLVGGFFADFIACFIYVPSEVLKTRLQLQGRHNNPHFQSGYNYKGMTDAIRTIVKQEGPAALYSGYKATIFRDLPFSALQFAFYEQEQNWARRYVGSRDLGLGLELATAASAGGLAGVITCPLDVVKTRTQTQVNPSETTGHGVAKISNSIMAQKPASTISQSNTEQRRSIITPSMSSSTASSNPARSNPTTSVLLGLRHIYRSEGLVGLFRGVGPRAVWTSVQSGTMLVLYQIILRKMSETSWLDDQASGIV